MLYTIVPLLVIAVIAGASCYVYQHRKHARWDREHGSLKLDILMSEISLELERLIVSDISLELKRLMVSDISLELEILMVSDVSLELESFDQVQLVIKLKGRVARLATDTNTDP